MAPQLVAFIALRQLWSRRGLNSAAVAGVALSVIVLVTISTIIQDEHVKLEKEVSRVVPHVTLTPRRLRHGVSTLEAYTGGPVVSHVTGVRPDTFSMGVPRPWDLVRRLAAVRGVTATCPMLDGTALVLNGVANAPIELAGVVPSGQDRCTEIIRHVHEGSWNDLGAVTNGVALGSRVAQRIGAHLGDHIALVASGHRAVSLKVVAIFTTGVVSVDRSRVYTSLTTAQAVFGKPGVVGQIQARIEAPFDSAIIARRFESLTGYDAETWLEANANFIQILALQKIVVQIIIAAILIVGGFGILAVQIMIVSQKRRDISILRSIGFRRSDILMTFLIQGVIIAGLGAAVGDLTSWRIISFLQTLEVNAGGFMASKYFIVNTSPEYYAYGAVFAMLAGLFASALPAWQASRVEPVDVLRGQA